MKYSNLEIRPLPKRFEVWQVLDVMQNPDEIESPEEVEYDFYTEEPYYRGADASWQFHIGTSATGIYAEWVRETQTLYIELPAWASKGDVELFASVINRLLAKHPRAKLYDGDSKLESITEGMRKTMLSERKRYLKKKLQTKEQFTMEGLLVHYDIDTAIERASGLSEDEMIERLQSEFAEMQWAEE